METLKKWLNDFEYDNTTKYPFKEFKHHIKLNEFNYNKLIQKCLQNNNYEEKPYKKWFLFENPEKKVKVYLIEWGSGHVSPYHTHTSGGCFLCLLKGEYLMEFKRNKDGQQLPTNLLMEHNIGFMHNDYGTHKIKNQNHNKVYSLHFYCS